MDRGFSRVYRFYLIGFLFSFGNIVFKADVGV